MKLFICGDSTAASYGNEYAPLTGWGQVLPTLLPGMAIENRAVAGRSTKTFLNEGRLRAIDPLLSSGDLMLIQFGHNDGGDKPERHTEPWDDFTDNLDAFIDAARSRGARPVLMTPICIRRWEGGRLLPSHGAYLDAIHALARRRGVPLVDHYAESRAIVSRLGEAGSRSLYMRLSPGEYPGWPDGCADDTHTRERGAEAFARAALDALIRLGLVGGIVEGTGKWREQATGNRQQETGNRKCCCRNLCFNGHLLLMGKPDCHVGLRPPRNDVVHWDVGTVLASHRRTTQSVDL